MPALVYGLPGCVGTPLVVRCGARRRQPWSRVAARGRQPSVLPIFTIGKDENMPSHRFQKLPAHTALPRPLVRTRQRRTADLQDCRAVSRVRTAQRIAAASFAGEPRARLHRVSPIAPSRGGHRRGRPAAWAEVEQSNEGNHAAVLPTLLAAQGGR
eukprot:364819-Chlamydomonas_euryale.AAC.3